MVNVTFNLSDREVRDQLTLVPWGERSKIITEALREYFSLHEPRRSKNLIAKRGVMQETVLEEDAL